MQNPQIKRALLSVTDKTGLVEFARVLQDEFDVEIVSTGGTAKTLEAAGITVRSIDDLTGFPEMMNGRVKTLHPKVHGGLLARRDVAEHLNQAQEHDIGLIDMVVVNLYAFEETVAQKEVNYADAIEQIDIGGPSMLRSAAKNHASVTVVTNPASYDAILVQMRQNRGATTLALRKQLALEVFRTTSAYDNAIYSWLSGELQQEESPLGDAASANLFPGDKRLFLTKQQDLRYGENPHQPAAFYKLNASASKFTLANATQVQGKELSYNNFLDLDAAWAAVREYEQPTTVIVKHLTPCGIASDSNITQAYIRAHACDEVSAYGGVMAFNVAVTAELIQAIFDRGQFIEALIAPEYETDALELLKEKPNARILVTGGINSLGQEFDYRSVEGGMLCMRQDRVGADTSSYEIVSSRQPTQEEYDEMLFAWRACKSVKSNAIVISKNLATIGIGAGQPNRVNSAELAVKQAGAEAQGAVAASDAFMPFADSLEVLARAGVTAVIQPGGSIRDQEVLAAANEANMAVIFTGSRHFRH